MSEAFQDGVPGAGVVGDTPPQGSPAPSTPAPGAAPSELDQFFGTTPEAPAEPASPVVGVPEWAQALENAETRSTIASKGWKSPEDMLESYKSLESKLGAPESALLRLKGIEDREAWHGKGGIFERLGRPQEASQYDFGEGVTLADNPRAQEFQKLFYEIGLTQHQAQEIAQADARMANAVEAAATQERATAFTQGLAQVRKDWGADFETNSQLAQVGMNSLGLTQDDLYAIGKQVGVGEILHKMMNLGKWLGGAPHGDPNHEAQTLMSPEQAKAELENMKSQSEVWARAMDEEKSAEFKKRRELMEIAYPG